MKKLFLLCACFLYATTAFSDVKTTGFTPGLLRLEISGSITQADYRRFTQLEEEVFPSIQKTTGKPVAFFVDLNSTGGDIRAAMGIGRILRNHIALAKVLGGSTCQSACVLVLAGAPSRAVWGTIGIHRPYDPRATATSAAEQKTLYKKMGTEVTAYLKEMNIPVKLYDDMLFISPENMKILTEDEISQYGLDKDDPFQAEANAARRAGDLRITRRELARREAMKKSVCNVSKCYAVLESLERIPNPLPPVCRVAFDCEEKIMKIGKP